MKKACIVTLGCRLNQADAALITDRLQRSGYTLVEPGEPEVELVVINSCAVTAAAGSKSRQAVTKWRKCYPSARIVATGCAVEADFDAWQQNKACDLVLTNVDKRSIEKLLPPKKAHLSIAEIADTFHENAVGCFPFRHRALVKIQEGCNNFCSYCIVPYTRGPERSRAVDEVIQECQKLIAAGVPEIVLTGVNTCAYHDSGYDLGKLVKAVCAEPGDFRIRLSSTEPHFNNLKLLESLADCGEKICRFLHLSLQYGSNRILQAMKRKYTTAEFAEFAAEARQIWPQLHLGTDVIVGFPGETESDFAECKDFVAAMQFANVHLFNYSPRPGTPAATFPNQVSGVVAKQRHEALQMMANAAAADFRAKQLGTVLPVIFEEEKQGQLHGWSDNYLAVSVPKGSFEIGKIVNITLDK